LHLCFEEVRRSCRTTVKEEQLEKTKDIENKQYNIIDPHDQGNSSTREVALST
jgi:hypothetical protein